MVRLDQCRSDDHLRAGLRLSTILVAKKRVVRPPPRARNAEGHSMGGGGEADWAEAFEMMAAEAITITDVRRLTMVAGILD